MDTGLRLLLENMQRDITEMKHDLKDLQKVRWINYGKVTTISAICSLIIGILIEIYKH